VFTHGETYLERKTMTIWQAETRQGKTVLISKESGLTMTEYKMQQGLFFRMKGKDNAG
jgi:hypothetical protein